MAIRTEIKKIMVREAKDTEQGINCLNDPRIYNVFRLEALIEYLEGKEKIPVIKSRGEPFVVNTMKEKVKDEHNSEEEVA